ncbi:hypothetical protein JCM10212_004815 [Sporobolomyces blumeae]
MATSLIFDSIPPRRAHLDGVPDSGDGVLIGVLEMRPTLYRFLRSCDYTRTTLGSGKKLVKGELYIFVRVVRAWESLVLAAAMEGDWEALDANWNSERFARRVRIMSLNDLSLEAVRYIDKLLGPRSEYVIGGLRFLDGAQEARLIDAFRKVRRMEPAPTADELKLSTHPTPLQRQALERIERRFRSHTYDLYDLCEELALTSFDFQHPKVGEERGDYSLWRRRSVRRYFEPERASGGAGAVVESDHGGSVDCLSSVEDVEDGSEDETTDEALPDAGLPDAAEPDSNESTDDEPATGSKSSSGPSATATSRIGANRGTTADKTTSSPTTTRAKRGKKGPLTRLASFFKKIVGRGFRSKRQEASKASKASKASNLSKADRSRGGR